MGCAKILTLILLAIFSYDSMAQRNRSKLPILATKQSLESLRFVSLDGRFNYYQRRSGALLLATNYQVVEVLQGSPGTHYTLSASPARQKVVISQNQTFHDYLSLRQGEKIYSVNYGEETPTYIDEGLYPELHLNDSWISYFNANTRHYHFRNFNNQALRFSIRLNNTRNPYFIPQSYMHTDSIILYKDLNQAGITGLLSYNRQEEEATLITKVDHADQTLEFCVHENHFFLMQRGINDSTFGTRVYHSTPAKILQGETPELVYTSEANDIGHLDCSAKKGSLYFIKNTGTIPNRHTYEVAELKLETKKVEVLSDLNYATQLVNLDGRLLIPYRGQFYVILGDSDLTEEDRLSPRIEPQGEPDPEAIE